MSRYEFLAEAHRITKPKTYLEVGVQLGASLAIAEDAELALGIDPYPQVLPHNKRPNQSIVAWTADRYFEARAQMQPEPLRLVDFAFIDGSHLFEDALRDFMNIEPILAGTSSVIFFDDVLPYSSAIATREQPPGDWTGDVWKVVEILRSRRPDLRLTLIDVTPTGLLMVQPGMELTDPPRDALRNDYGKIVATWLAVSETVPAEYINRSSAVSGDVALGLLSEKVDS